MRDNGKLLKYCFIAFSLLLTGLNPALGQRIIVETWDNGKEKVVFDITKGTYEKPIDYYFFKFYPNGKVYKEGNYVTERVSGEWKFYYQDGNPKSIATYAFGNLSGEYKSYYISGEIEQKGQFQVGQLTGVELFNHDGSKKERDEDLSYLISDTVKAWTQAQKDISYTDCYMPMEGIYPAATEYCTCIIDSVAQYVEYDKFYYLTEYQRSILFRYLMEYKEFCRGIIENPKEMKAD